jgi:hypothetical protein
MLVTVWPSVLRGVSGAAALYPITATNHFLIVYKWHHKVQRHLCTLQCHFYTSESCFFVVKLAVQMSSGRLWQVFALQSEMSIHKRTQTGLNVFKCMEEGCRALWWTCSFSTLHPFTPLKHDKTPIIITESDSTPHFTHGSG